MKARIIVAIAGFAALAFLLAPREADACSWCSMTGPRCERANYSGCNVAKTPDGFVCEQWASTCAWVYDASEVSADGSLALASAPAAESVSSAGETEVGCNGLIVARAYSDTRVEQVRGRSGTIRI